MSPSNERIRAETVEAVAGITAGLASTIAVHPLDIIKTRMQLDTSSSPLLNSSRSVFRDILRNEGPTRIRALYRGLSPNLFGNSAGWGLYFMWYRQGQDLLRNVRGYTHDQVMTNVDYLIASAGSGALSAVLTNPIWVVKTRMISTSSAIEGAYPSMIYGFKSIYRKEGLRGYFHGLTPALFGVTHGALYFVAYENLKILARARTGQEELSNTDTSIAAALSKVFAGTATYPSQVVRSRLQTYDPALKVQRKSLGVVRIIRELWRNEGALGFYKGLIPNLARVVPSTCVTFLVYENTKWALPRMFNDDAADSKTAL